MGFARFKGAFTGVQFGVGVCSLRARVHASVRAWCVLCHACLCACELRARTLSRLSGCDMNRPGRLFVTESQMHKMCRKGLKVRYFWLCSDVLIYGTPITKGKYTGQAVLELSTLSVENIEDSAEGANGIQINNKCVPSSLRPLTRAPLVCALNPRWVCVGFM